MMPANDSCRAPWLPQLVLCFTLAIPLVGQQKDCHCCRPDDECSCEEGKCACHAPEPADLVCTAKTEAERVIVYPDKHTEHLVTVTARAPKQLLFSTDVRAENEKAKAKALARAADICAKWVSAQVKDGKQR